MKIFVDTSAFFALLSKTDKNHEDATTRWGRFLANDAVNLFTSNYVVVETCSLLSNRLGMSAVTDFIQSLLPTTTVLWMDESTHSIAIVAMLGTGINGPSLVDCSSFTLMQAWNLRLAFAYDKHFTVRGLS